MCSQAPTPTLPTLTVAENTPLLALGHLRPNRTILTQNVKDKIEINSALWRRAFYYYHDLEKKETRLYEPGMIANPTSLKGTWFDQSEMDSDFDNHIWFHDLCTWT